MAIFAEYVMTLRYLSRPMRTPRELGYPPLTLAHGQPEGAARNGGYPAKRSGLCLGANPLTLAGVPPICVRCRQLSIDATWITTLFNSSRDDSEIVVTNKRQSKSDGKCS